MSERSCCTVWWRHMHCLPRKLHADIIFVRLPISSRQFPSYQWSTYGGRGFAVAGPLTWNSLPKCSLASPSTGQWETCPTRLPTIYFFQLTLELHRVWQRLCAVVSRNISCSATAAAVVQSRQHKLVQCVISRHFMCDKKFHVVLCPLAPDPGDATANVYAVLPIQRFRFRPTRPT